MVPEKIKMKRDRKYLLNMLKQYGESDMYPFHMPGHKRQEINDECVGGFPNPYGIDITEVYGFDNLHHAEGILKNSMMQAAEIYRADHTYYLVNGSTCGILSAVCGCVRNGGKILMARNCHKASYHGLILNRLMPVYLYPEFLEKFGINGGVFPEDVKKALESDREIEAVFLVSPTYEGIVSDIGSIAEIVHEYGIPLIVDEAHGAHFPFSDGREFPESALYRGADVVIQSLHKTLPSFTQTAVLHIKGNLADRVKIEQYLGMFQSSSPSYIFMAAMERCIFYMDGAGKELLKRYGKRMRLFFEHTKTYQALKVLDKRIISEDSVYDWDQSKIVVSVKGINGVDGEWLSDRLREKYHLEMEMCAPDYVIAMTSFLDREEGFVRLQNALTEIDDQLSGEAVYVKTPSFKFPGAKMAISPAVAMDSRGKEMPLSESEGMISREFLYLYPPGIPLLVPGEVITKEILSAVFRYKTWGFSVQGLSDHSLSTIITVAKQ